MKLIFEWSDSKNSNEYSKNHFDIICKKLYLFCMSKKLLISEQFAWSPEPAENPVGRIPVIEGKNLPNSIEEDVRNFLLSPIYSPKQLRRIKRLCLKKSKDMRKQIRYKQRRGYYD